MLMAVMKQTNRARRVGVVMIMWCGLQEELAAVNLAKYRKAQSDLDEAEERLAENAAEMTSRSRFKNAMSSTATRPGVGVCLS